MLRPVRRLLPLLLLLSACSGGSDSHDATPPLDTVGDHLDAVPSADLNGDVLPSDSTDLPGLQDHFETIPDLALDLPLKDLVDGGADIPAQDPGIPWSEGPYGTGFMEVVGDFTVPTTAGDWTFSQEWTGLDSYLFLFYYPYGTSKNVWQTSVAELLDKAPQNVHFFFGSYDDKTCLDNIEELQERVDTALADRPDQHEWEPRIHYINVPVGTLTGAVGDSIADKKRTTLAIDRFQRWREVGSLFDWKNYFEGQPVTEQYPMWYLANEAHFFNYEAESAAELEALDTTYLPLWQEDQHPGGWGGGYSSKWTVQLPSAEEMGQFDGAALTLYTACPNHLQGKENGCNEWDYIQALYLCDREVTDQGEPMPESCQPAVPETPPTPGTCSKSGVDCTTIEECGPEGGDCVGFDPGEPAIPAETLPCSCEKPWGEVVEAVRKCNGDGTGFGECQCACDTEFARWVTPYGREGDWVTDVSPFLVFLRQGGAVTFRFAGANGYILTGGLHCYDQGTNLRPFAARPLWGKASGESFNLDYNGLHPPIAFTPPEGTKAARIAALISGHGHSSTVENCAEFCDHQHRFQLNGASTYEKNHPDAGTWYGCQQRISQGVVPNQFGTWVFGRGGWCPGQHVELWQADISTDLVSGENTVTYDGLYQGQDYDPTPNGQGDYMPEIKMSSWLIFYESVE